MFKIGKEATNCLYVDGVPNDATEREVAHIFRPFPGFIQSRLIPKVNKNGKKFFFCFVDFDDKIHASIARDTLQSYHFSPKDSKGVRINYATPTNQVKRGRD